jgi:hypothetical protein
MYPLADELVKKICIYVWNGILLSYKKEWNYVTYSEINATGGHYGTWNKMLHVPLCETQKCQSESPGVWLMW